MGKKIDITERLEFEDNPKLIIRGKELEVNTDAPTVLKIMSLMGDEAPGAKEILKAYELIFTEQARQEIDKLKLNFKDLVTVIQMAIALVTGDDAKAREQ